MFRISVTAQHIRDGIPRSSTADPIALAARAAGFGGAVTTPAGLKVGSRAIDFPDDVCCWIADFDSGRPVDPIAWAVPPLDGPGWREIGVQRGAKA